MSNEAAQTWALVMGAVTFLNLGILGLTLKLYTEFAKDRFQQARRPSPASPAPSSPLGTPEAEG